MFGRIPHRHITPDLRDPRQARVIHQFDEPITRGRFASWWDAWTAIRAKICLPEYLGFRLRHYQSFAPQTRHPQPFDVSVDSGEVIQTPNLNADAHPWQRILDDPAGEDAFEAATVSAIRFLSQSESQTVLRDLQQYEDELSRYTSDIMEVTDNLVDLEVERRREIVEGKLPVSATLSRPPRHRGRSSYAIFRLLLAWVCCLAIAATVLVEAWQFATAYYDATGIDPSDLEKEWERNKVGILAGGGFAVAASAAIFLLWYWVIKSTVSLFRNADSEVWWKTAVQAVVPLVLGGVLILTAFWIGDMRRSTSVGASDFLGTMHGQETGENGSTGVFVLLTIIVPLAVAYLQHELGPIWSERREIGTQRGQWTRNEHQALLVRERRTELMRLLEEKRSHIERRRNEARNKIRELAERAQASERLIRETLEAERRFGVAYMNSLIAALEQDRYAFLKIARRRGAEDLIHGQSRGSAMASEKPLLELAPGPQKAYGGNR